MELSGKLISQLCGSKDGLFSGRSYILTKVSLIRAGCPVELRNTTLNQATGMPIVIGCNKWNYGYIAATEYAPDAVVVAGDSRRRSLLQQGFVHTYAWVEKEACPALSIDASIAVTSDELLKKIQSQLEDKFFSRNPNGQQMPGQAYPGVVSVFPFESRSVFQHRGENHIQPYTIDPGTREVKLGLSMKACGDAKQGPMNRVQTGVRYAYAPPMGNTQSSTTGARNSELITQIVRDWSDINESVNMYLDAIKYGLHKPMRPKFYPVNLSDDGKIVSALAAAGVDAFDFSIWSCYARKMAAVKKTKAHGGVQVPMSKHAYVGDPKDPSTWKLPVDTPGRASNALARVNQTQGIPQSAKPGVMQKIRRAAKGKGVDVSDKPTSGQKDWMHRGKVAAMSMESF